MEIIKNTNLLLRFLLEIGVLISIVYWGFHGKSNLAFKIGIGIVLPISIMFIWGVFVAPKSTFQLQLPIRLVVELIIFGIGVFSLFASGHPGLGKLFAVVVCVNILLLLYWKK